MHFLPRPSHRRCSAYTRSHGRETGFSGFYTPTHKSTLADPFSRHLEGFPISRTLHLQSTTIYSTLSPTVILQHFAHTISCRHGYNMAQDVVLPWEPRSLACFTPGSMFTPVAYYKRERARISRALHTSQRMPKYVPHTPNLAVFVAVFPVFLVHSIQYDYIWIPFICA